MSLDARRTDLHSDGVKLSERLARTFYPYGAERRVLLGPCRGLRFLVQPGMGCTYALGMHRAVPRIFQEQIRPGMTVVDVGANTGQMTLLFATLVGPSGRVVALEPSPAEFQILQQNVQLNGWSHVQMVPVAASETDDECEFLYPPDRPTQGKLAGVEPSYAVGDARTLRVTTKRLDDLLGNERPDLVKIDVEGAAAVVLRGARHMLSTIGPAVYIELHGPDEQGAVRDELLTRGYIARSLAGDVIADPVAQWSSPLWCVKREQIGETPTAGDCPRARAVERDESHPPRWA